MLLKLFFRSAKVVLPYSMPGTVMFLLSANTALHLKLVSSSTFIAMGYVGTSATAAVRSSSLNSMVMFEPGVRLRIFSLTARCLSPSVYSCFASTFRVMPVIAPV